MSNPTATSLPFEEENHLLRARITRLEQEIAYLRNPSAEPHLDEPPREESEQYSKEVFDHISVCMFLIDVTADGRFRYAGFNPAEERALGLSSAQVSGKYVEEVFEEDLSRKLTEHYRQCVEGGVAITYDDELDLPEGRRYFHSNLIPVRNGAGRIHRIVGACIDTTDFKRTQEEAMARQKLESIGLLATGIAHDFNNLLGSILAETELAESELSEGSSPVGEIQTIKAVATRAGEIVRELMIYAGHGEASLEPVDLSRVVEEMLELLKISISKNAILQVDLPKGLPTVRANVVQVRQMVMNLITNASEAIGDKRGVISVRISRVEAGEHSPVDAASPFPGYLRLTVSDTGTGMTEEVRSRIFDPFYTTKFAGRGLGLAAVQGMIRAHGGSIEVTSVPGQGSTFEILLPCAGEPMQQNVKQMESKTHDEPGRAAATVLVIEDEDVLRSAVATLLRKEGFLVIECADGAAGVRLFASNRERIDVILLDMTLPGMPGGQVLEEVRGIRPDARVILTSAYSRDALSVPDGEAPWGYIRKPYPINDLVNLLRHACAPPRG